MLGTANIGNYLLINSHKDIIKMLSANSRALTPAVTELLDKVEQREINGDGPG